jgi:hypothetical protein
MTPTDAQIEAVRKILYEWFATSIEMDNSDWDSAAEEAIAELDIEKIEREAYERGMKDIAEMVEQWYDNYCNHIPQADLMRVLATVMEGLR